MQRGNMPEEDRIDLVRLRMAALFPVGWFVLGIILPNFVMGIVVGGPNEWVETTAEGIGVLLLGGCMVYLLVLVRKERWILRVVLAGMAFLLLSVLLQAARRGRFFDTPAAPNMQNVLRQSEIALNGLGLAAIVFAFFWAIIDLLAVRHRLTAEQARLSTEMANREQIEEALSESEARYRGLYDSVKDGVVRATLDGRIIETNIAYQEMLG
jgi:PAS domain-containing protein